MTDLYELAKKYFVDTQNKQIQKGLSTYGKALDPAEWTTQQLYQHAMDEIVDNVHYLTALLVRSEAAVKRAAEFEAFVKEIAEDSETPYNDIAQRLLDKPLFSSQKPLFTDVVKKPLSPSSIECDHKYKFVPSETRDPLRAEWKCDYCGKVIPDIIKR